MLERFDPMRKSENPCYRAFASYQTGLYERAREAIRGLGRPHVRVLDAACGVGYGSTYLADLGAYEGLDADRETVERRGPDGRARRTAWRTWRTRRPSPAAGSMTRSRRSKRPNTCGRRGSSCAIVGVR